MALRLIGRGPVGKPLTPQRLGSGWVNCADSKGSVYPAERIGTAQTTATATGCDAVRIIDWAVSVERATVGRSEGLHSATAITVGRFGPVVQVLNPTENTEVQMHVVPIPPPYLVELARRGGGCRGAKTNRTTNRQRGRVVGNPVRQARHSDGRRVGRHPDSAPLGRCGAGSRGAHRRAEHPVPLRGPGRHVDGVRRADHDQSVRADHLRGLTPVGVSA